MGYITGTTSKTEQERLRGKAHTAREALQDFWGAYVDHIGGPERVNRTALNVFSSVNSALASVERTGAAGGVK
jgi:hypothetical protein